MQDPLADLSRLETRPLFFGIVAIVYLGFRGLPPFLRRFFGKFWWGPRKPM